MEITNLTQEELTLVAKVFDEIRQKLQKYMDDRDFQMSNAQIFTFLLYAPVALAIASDREVDEQEIRILEKICRNIDVNKTVDINLLEVLSVSPEPSNIMLNEEFNMRIDAELLYLSRNMNKYENDITEALKTFLNLDINPQSETSLHNTLTRWFDYVVERNAGRNKEEELKKIKQYKEKIGL